MSDYESAPARSPRLCRGRSVSRSRITSLGELFGGRLPGSVKKHVTPEQNEYGTPLSHRNPRRELEAQDSMAQAPVRLTIEQRKTVEAAILEVTQRYSWTIHAIAPQSDHEHVVITACRVGYELRDALKAVASRALNKAFAKQTWWAEGGSAKYIWDRSYLENARKYVHDQRDF